MNIIPTGPRSLLGYERTRPPDGDPRAGSGYGYSRAAPGAAAAQIDRRFSLRPLRRDVRRRAVALRLPRCRRLAVRISGGALRRDDLSALVARRAPAHLGRGELLSCVVEFLPT